MGGVIQNGAEGSVIHMASLWFTELQEAWEGRCGKRRIKAMWHVRLLSRIQAFERRKAARKGASRWMEQSRFSYFGFKCISRKRVIDTLR